MAGRRARGRGAQNVQQKLRQKLEDGDYYEALQIYKTLSARHMGSKDIKKAADTVRTGSLEMIEFKQSAPAMELAKMLVDIYVENGVKVSPETKGAVLTIIEACKADHVYEQAISFIRAAVKWSTTNGDSSYGDATLRCELARFYAQLGEFKQASTQYLYAERPQELAELTFEWAEQGYPSERDLFIARAVLQLLALENLRDANLLFENFKDLCGKRSLKVDTPLSRFLEFLLKTCERDAGSLFQMLRQQYAPSIQRDPQLSTYLDIIGKKFFKIEPPKSGLSSLLSLFGGGL